MLNLNNNNLEDAFDGISIKKFHDARPQKGTKYFSTPFHYDDEGNQIESKGDIAVIIPFYNEEAKELRVTLESLYGAYDYLCEMKPDWKDKQLHIMIIQDGWYKASETMKEYLQELFPKKYQGKGWWEHHPEFKEYDFAQNGALTYVFENNLDYTCINQGERYKHKKMWLKLTLVVKIDNRRKHNSHEWFMAKSGFAESVNSKYMFFTDAFTLFGPTCLYHLVNTLDNNETYSAATGRQRVMSRDQQGTYEPTLSIAYMLRMVQMYDFELANAVYNGAFSIGGCLPVIPGPCGLYRSSDVLQDAVRDWYFNVIAEEPENTGLILGNLKIAEDRILTYSSVLKTKDVKYMAFVSLAVFYFEAELSLERLILQRRRWINGSIAGYIYLLFTNSEHIRKWKVNFFRKSYIYFLLLCQFLIYCSVAIAPAYSLRMLHYSLDYLFQVLNIDNTDVGILTTIGWILYLSHILVHSKNKYNTYIMNLLLLLTYCTSVLSFAAIIYYVFIDTNESLMDLLTSGSVVLYLSLFVFFGPFVLALLLSLRGHSIMNMFKAFIPYLLFLHMLITWFGSYAYSRTWDLTWGNRPQEEHNSDREKREQMKKKFDLQAKNIALGIFVLNVIIFFLPREVQLGILSVFFFCATVQMLFSFLYMMRQLPKKCGFCYLKCKKCVQRQVKDINYKNKEKLRKELEEEEQKEQEAIDLEVAQPQEQKPENVVVDIPENQDENEIKIDN